jgi:hypothetical protein
MDTEAGKEGGRKKARLPWPEPARSSKHVAQADRAREYRYLKMENKKRIGFGGFIHFHGALRA